MAFAKLLGAYDAAAVVSFSDGQSLPSCSASMRFARAELGRGITLSGEPLYHQFADDHKESRVS